MLPPLLSSPLLSSQGHLLLIGVSGAGKTTLSRFVAWINGLSVFQVKVSPTTLPVLLQLNYN